MLKTSIFICFKKARQKSLKWRLRGWIPYIFASEKDSLHVYRRSKPFEVICVGVAEPPSQCVYRQNGYSYPNVHRDLFFVNQRSSVNKIDSEEKK